MKFFALNKKLSTNMFSLRRVPVFGAFEEKNPQNDILLLNQAGNNGFSEAKHAAAAHRRQADEGSDKAGV